MREALPQGNDTQLAGNSIWKEEERPLEEFFEARNDFFTTFPEKVWEFAQRHGHTGGKEDKGALIRFLSERIRQAGGTLSAATVKNWLTKSPPSARSREQVYQLCFALELSVDEADEFFIKAYWDRPFDFKESYECVYWFCMKNGLSYQKTQELRKQAEETGQAGAEQIEAETARIEMDIRELDSEEDLLYYIRSHSGVFAHRNVTARQEALALLEECRDIADQLDERYGVSRYLSDGRGDKRKAAEKKRSDARLLEAIYGVNLRSVEEKARVYQGWTFTFPAYVKRCFPQVSHLQEIRAGKPVTYDTIRKALIMLKFYSFFGDQQLNGMDENGAYGDFDLFEAEVNGMLVRCGYGALYYRNPYDYLFAYCAAAEDPLGKLQDYIAAYWDEK